MKIDENNLIYGILKKGKEYFFISKKEDELKLYSLLKTFIKISKNKLIKQPFPLDYEVDKENNLVHIFMKDSTIITHLPSYNKK